MISIDVNLTREIDDACWLIYAFLVYFYSTEELYEVALAYQQTSDACNLKGEEVDLSEKRCEQIAFLELQAKVCFLSGKNLAETVTIFGSHAVVTMQNT